MSGFEVRPGGVFRASRDYYHSTDLHDALVEALRARGIDPGAFDLKLRGRIDHDPVLHIIPGASPPVPDAPAVARFSAPQGPWSASVTEGVEAIQRRKPYDEQPIWSRTRQVAGAYVADGCSFARPIEVVTAVAVLAHRELLPPPAGMRWLLAQLTAERALGEADQDHCRIEIVRRVGSGMTQSTVADRAGVFGKMVFILK